MLASSMRCSYIARPSGNVAQLQERFGAVEVPDQVEASEKFAAHAWESASLRPEVVASAHGPVHRRDEIADAYTRTFDLVGRTPVGQPGQDVLEMLLSVLVPAA